MKNENDPRINLEPLFETILEKVPVAKNDTKASFRMQAFNLAYDNFLGRLAVGRVYEGIAKTGDTIFVKNHQGQTRQAKITKLYTFKGMNKVEVSEAEAGDIVMVAGIADIFIGETISKDKDAELLPAISIDEPTIVLDFLVNNSPFAGREGKFVTSRQIKERLEKELEINVGLKVDFSPDANRDIEGYKVFGRGEMHIAVLLENMRRDGYEVQVSQPKVIFKEVDGRKLEPFEEVTIDTPSEYQGAVIEKLGLRTFSMTDMKVHDQSVRMLFKGPTRGLFGYRGQFIIDTKGEGIMSSRVVGFEDYVGEIKKREVGSMVSMENGKALGYSLWNLQDRGTLYISPATEVYEGMVIGNTSKGEEMVVNPIKNKQLTNFRASGTDESINLTNPWELTIERGLEVMQDDEYLEVTPKSVRLRKIYLNDAQRAKAKRK